MSVDLGRGDYRGKKQYDDLGHIIVCADKYINKNPCISNWSQPAGIGCSKCLTCCGPQRSTAFAGALPGMSESPVSHIILILMHEERWGKRVTGMTESTFWTYCSFVACIHVTHPQCRFAFCTSQTVSAVWRAGSTRRGNSWS